MKKLLILLSLIAISIYGFGQHTMVANNGETISACSGSLGLGSYTVGQTYTVTICSNHEINQHITFAVTGGYNFPAGTSLCFYDGTSTSAPLITCWDNGTTSGQLAVQTGAGNESGCLTVVFTGGTSGASWGTNAITCNFVCQPRSVVISSANPPIVGNLYIDVCWDENNDESFPITFNAEGEYPSTSYDCTDATNTFTWNFNDGSPLEVGLGLTSVTHTFSERRGYNITVSIEDSQGCLNTNSEQKRVRVSLPPIWNNTTTVLTTTPATNPPAICMGSPVHVCGYYSNPEWTSVVPLASGDTVCVPDNPPLCYESILHESSFEPGQELTSINDIISIDMNLAHHYLGDLTFYVICPNGQQVQIGAQGGGGTYLGYPGPNRNSCVGDQGMWYHITPTATQTMQQAASGTWQTTLPSGNYASYQSLSALIDCPLNGTWQLRLCDNWGQDAGTIFGWSIQFDPSLYPAVWDYTQTYTPTSWDGLYGSVINAPNNQNCMDGTYTTSATPDVNSLQPFIFTITDNFGCTHDTALYVTVRHQLDPNCCVIPSVDAGSDDAICALTYHLQASSLEFPGNTGNWEMISGPGTATFTNPTNPSSNVTVSLFGTYVFRFHERHNDNPGCASHDDVTITFNDTYDPTISPVSNMCVNLAPFMLEMVDFGSLSINLNSELLNIATGQFNPAKPGTYTITNTVQDPCTGGPLSHSITFTVYDAITVQNFQEYCGPIAEPTNFYVEFDVVGSQGGPFSGYLLNGVTHPNPHYTATLVSPSAYGYTVADPNGCSSFVLDGYRDCGCPLYAGTMGSLQTVVLCEDECTTPAVTHNGNEETDGGAGRFEFIIHTGDNEPIAYSDDPNFCFTAPLQFNTTYYVSPICGLPIGPNGHANISSGCYSVGQGTPVMWLKNPHAYAGINKDTCGLIIQLNGNTPEGDMYGYWSSTCDFITVGGTNHRDPNAIVMASGYQDCTFTWNIVNGECGASDDVLIRFLATPSPYAGPDIVVCGNVAQMDGQASMDGDLTWSGSGTSFNPLTAADANSQVSVYGTYQYTLIEDNGSCTGSDKVLVTYVKPPSPITTPNVDTVCGTEYNLSVTTIPNAIGQWVAYDWDETLEDWVTASPHPLFSPNVNSTNVNVTIGNYPGLNRPLRFVWTESNIVGGLECTGETYKDVVFAKQPIASVGASNYAEICGNCIDLHASTIGTSDYTCYWIPKVNGEWTNPEGAQSPDATYCVDVPAAFGDTAKIHTEFFWVVRNGGCMSTDVMNVIFYQQPQANAGLDDAICGFDYDLAAYWGVPGNDIYSPTGVWSVGSKPSINSSANIQDVYDPSSHVTVSETGIWEFIFRENNTQLTSCYSTDTVQIEFVEIPIISAGPDQHVCGNCVNLQGISGGFSGTWLPNGAIFDDYEDPTTQACVATYDTLVFTWQESNSATTQTLPCPASDDVNIIFWRVPSANIMTDEADSTVCGLRFNNLRAENPGQHISGYWYNINPYTEYGDKFSNNTWAQVPNYGYHDFYWIEETGAGLTPGFCNDTAGPLRIHFIQVPTANAGGDTLFCGLNGQLSAIPSIGTGVWSTPSVANISFENQNNPNTGITSTVINTENPTYPFFNLIWTEDNTNGCTDKDTIKVVFARVPSSEIKIIPPKCFGEYATIAAAEDTLQQYTWNFYSGIRDSATYNPMGGRYQNFVRWEGSDTLHRISLIASNYWECQSAVTVDTVFEPAIPKFDHIIVNDTCALGKGGIIFLDTLGSNAFFWIDPEYGPEPGTPFTSVYNIPAGEYDVGTAYLTPNLTHYAYYNSTFGSANCLDTISYEIIPIGMIIAKIEVSAEVVYEELVAPNANVIFVNKSDYDNIGKKCEWHFGDGTAPLKSCDQFVEHTYTKGGCYEPFLIVMNRDLLECRDTAWLDECIPVDEASEIEVPNIFSPNGDGINDFFQVKAKTLKEFNGIITNRWGRQVYEWTDWETYEAGWDGNIGGGSKAAPGVYYYTIRAEGYDGQIYELYGALHLMRE
ncbi:MAG: gliding motility-associated C-terminal domain-containing protein [Bacteroidales bacterium]|nr:gliding motility-associated C-terminal domain-containing protein [Bacteroidales bacterium]